jgi:hypothetical protein
MMVTVPVVLAVGGFWAVDAARGAGDSVVVTAAAAGSTASPAATPEEVRSTDAYLHADISIKEKALALTTPASARPGRYHHRTRSSRSSKACDYAEVRIPDPYGRMAVPGDLGIVAASA